MASAPTLPGSRKVIPVSLPLWKRCVVYVIHVLIRVISATLRVRLVDPAGVLERHGASPLIFCIWHNQLALCLEIYRRFFVPMRPGRRMAAMVSASGDGALVARLLELSGAVPARGSSSRRGPQAMLEMKTMAAKGLDLALTPDGPRGPRYKAQTGAVSLGQLTGLALLPVSCELTWKIQLKSWDRFQIPIPFSRWTIRVEEPVWIGRELSPEDRELKRVELEEKLRRITFD